MATNVPVGRVSEALYVGEQFVSNDSVADAAIGHHNWEIVTIANATTYAYLTAQPYGGLRMTTNGTAQGDGSVLRTFTDGLVFNDGGGFIKTRVRYPNITGNLLATNNFRIGADDSVTATSPTVGIWIDSAAGVLSLQADSADHGDVSASAANLGGMTNTLTNGTTMVLGTWHTIEVYWSGSNANGGPDSAAMVVDGFLVAQLNGNIVIDDDEEVELKIAHWQTATGGDTLELDIDYFEFCQYRKP